MQPNVVLGPQPGDVIDGRYVVREPIGEGGMGSVFLASQPALERMVAIKFLHPELAGSPAQARRRSTAWCCRRSTSARTRGSTTRRRSHGRSGPP